MSRLSVDDARALWEEASDEELRRLAQDVRSRWHDRNRATYMVMRIINYTNVCVAQCDYCAFYVLPNQQGGYVLSREEVFEKIDELVDFGGDLVAFNGGFNPRLPLDYYCDLFASVRERYGDRVEFYALTVAEFVFLADRAGLSYGETAARLRDAGVHWVTGGGSEILTEDFRARHAKWKYTVADYFDAQRAIIESGMRTTATMVIGFDETLDEGSSTYSGRATSRTKRAVSSRSSAGRTSRTEPPSAAARSRRPSTGATSRCRESSSRTSSTSARPC
jgi:cyclic dehypoxanthinyl futalosine synthase